MDEYRLRLEGRAALLDAARLRSRALVEALGARAWVERTRQVLPLVREAQDVQPRVNEALAAALRRAQAEAWPSTSPTVQCLREVHALQEKLSRSITGRLSLAPGAPLPELLLALEERILTTPREIAPAQRGPTALELLPERLPLWRDLTAFGALLESLFESPADPEDPLPFTAQDAEALRLRWPRGEVALATAWARLAGVDQTGGLVNDLRKRAERAPLRPPRDGPERLLHAEFWRGVARKWIEALVRVRFSPLVPTETERFELTCWLWAREHAPERRLPSSPTLSDARAGLLEMAHELWRLLRTGEEQDLPDEQWARLRERARRADQKGLGLDADRLREVLRTFIWQRGMGAATQRGWHDTTSSLEALVEQARRVDGQKTVINS